MIGDNRKYDVSFSQWIWIRRAGKRVDDLIKEDFYFVARSQQFKLTKAGTKEVLLMEEKENQKAHHS